MFSTEYLNQLDSELLSAGAVQKEVDGVVEIHEHVNKWPNNVIAVAAAIHLLVIGGFRQVDRDRQRADKEHDTHYQ